MRKVRYEALQEKHEEGEMMETQTIVGKINKTNRMANNPKGQWVTIGDIELSYWGGKNLKTGEIVKIQFSTTEKNGKVFKNVQDLEVMEALPDAPKASPQQAQLAPETAVKAVSENEKQE